MATEPRTAISVEDLLTRVRGRDLGCEGIPMLLALHGAQPAPAGDPRRVRGERLAPALEAIHREVVKLASHPRTRAQRARAVADADAVIEGAATVQSGRADADALALDAEAARAVPEDERLLAEAVAVLAHVELADPPIELDLPGPGPRAAAGTPLARMVTALAEGRYVTVVNYHNTPVSTAAHTEAELAAWGERHAPVAPDDLAGLIATGEWPHARPPLIPVMYEGYANNAEVAAPALTRAGLVGWFFLITGFLDAPAGEQEAFADAHEIATAAEETGQGRALAMSWAQARALASDHVVTAHTAHHVAAHNVADAEAVAREITAPAAAVARATGSPAPAHAWLFGSALAPDGGHTEALAGAGFRWLFSNTGIDALPVASGTPGSERT